VDFASLKPIIPLKALIRDWWSPLRHRLHAFVVSVCSVVPCSSATRARALNPVPGTLASAASDPGLESLR
jgi:hypothetical protein